ncbi:DUF4785 domain-containing protein [Planctobacterium marinum]|uniref:DUF4785 domain-containing protein n=1 Tax=Planctobacterium marinum TaxID=1631968 RepID=A0AA48HJB7_9ALTE|nr:DUF4785 domain-containing protein [Planctobacterium marinum]
MKKSQLTKITTVGLLSAFITMNSHAETQTAFKAKTLADITLPAPEQMETKRVEYVWPVVMQEAKLMSKQQQAYSDEYWQTITGEQINRGVPVYVSDEALIRLAPKARYSSGARQVSPGINLNQLSITQSDGRPAKLNLIAGQQEMQNAGFNDGSVAVKISNVSNKPLFIQSQNKLAADTEYLLHVKEKNSPYQLKLAMPSHFDGETSLTINASLHNQKLVPFSTEVKLLSPSGEELDAQLRDSQVVFNNPLTEFGARNGLYQLELHTAGNAGGKLVKRSVKLPFVNVAKTASLGEIQIDERVALDINVFDAGRYNVSATLQGIDRQGNLQRLQTADVAETLSHNKQLVLPFDLSKFSQFKNFSLVDVKLTDQSRLMTLEVHSAF